jgi:hypothetical protein
LSEFEKKKMESEDISVRALARKAGVSPGIIRQVGEAIEMEAGHLTAY